MVRTRDDPPAAENRTVKSGARGDIPDKVLKKREIDRRSQRKARERTKSRIAELESQLEDFKKGDIDASITSLLTKLDQTEAERLKLDNTLKSLENIIASHHSSQLQRARQGLLEIDNESQDTAPNFRFVTTAGPAAPPSIASEENVTPPEACDMNHVLQNIPIGSGSTVSTAASTDNSEFGIAQSDDFKSRESGNSYPGIDASQSDVSCAALHIRLNRPNMTFVCPCHPLLSSKSFNRWRYINEVLMLSFRHRGFLSNDDSGMNEDVPIRAILDGWDSVEKTHELPIGWQLMRCIDETLFSTCGNTERLAIMFFMHQLLLYHDNSTLERYSRLPSWYIKSPSQNLAHSYAINFFGWPGLRERFIFAEHTYCENEFYDVFCSSLRIRWPFSFRDCYVRQADTGLCSISSTFSNCIYDLRNWAMGPDIFERYPELHGDLPALHASLHSVSNLQQWQFANVELEDLQDGALLQNRSDVHEVKKLNELLNFGANILLPNESTPVNLDVLGQMCTSFVP